MSGGVPTRLHAQYLPHATLERHPLSQKKKLFTSSSTLNFTLTESHAENITVEITKQMNFNYPRR